MSSNKTSLDGLIGKTIKDISVKEIDRYGNEENVVQYYTIEFSDGTKTILTGDSGVSFQYLNLFLMTEQEYLDELKNLEDYK